MKLKKLLGMKILIDPIRLFTPKLKKKRCLIHSKTKKTMQNLRKNSSVEDDAQIPSYVGDDFIPLALDGGNTTSDLILTQTMQKNIDTRKMN